MLTKKRISLFSKHSVWKTLFVSIVLSLLLFNVVLAAAGDLDLTFGGDGKVTTNFGGGFSDWSYAVAIQSDGKIVAAGQRYDPADSSNKNHNFALARYNENGSLDKFFSSDGKQITDFGAIDSAWDVAVQSDGKIIAAGQTCNATSYMCDVAIARYKPSGILDVTFSNDGKVTIDFGGNDNGSSGGIALQSDGKIIVAGYMSNGTDYDFSIYRLNANGTMDSTFSSDGMTNFGFGSGRNDMPNDLTLQANGKIVITGSTCDVNFKNCNFAVASLNSNGTLDTTFNSSGKQITNFGGEDKAWGVDVQSNGKIVVAGQKSVDGTLDTASFAVARYNTNGKLDATFSGDGRVTTKFLTGFGAFGRDVAVQSDGKIVVMGGARTSTGDKFSVARYNTNGNLDNTFSGDGKVMVDFGLSGWGGAALAIQSDGKYVLVGALNDGTQLDFALARVLP